MHDMTDAVTTPDGRKSDVIFAVAAKELSAS